LPEIDDTIPNAWIPVAPVVAATAPVSPPAERLPQAATETAPVAHAAPPGPASRASIDRPEVGLIASHAIELPRVSMELPADSGLVLVETARERVASEPVEEPEQPRPRRQRAARPQLPDEPLQMVETHKEPTPPTA
jgi:hypothetical protein